MTSINTTRHLNRRTTFPYRTPTLHAPWLPGGHCSCPHWGYVIKGTMTVRYGDVEEKVQAGEAFYMPPGHIPGATAGTEFVQFSPTDQLKPVLAAMADSLRKMREA
jgi:hypothetical protein